MKYSNYYLTTMTVGALFFIAGVLATSNNLNSLATGLWVFGGIIAYAGYNAPDEEKYV